MKHIKRCVIAALFVLSALFFCMAALADEENAPKISDWGIFDEETGATTSLNGTGVIDGSTINGSFYIQFDHNVAERTAVNVADANCALISVRRTDGRTVAADVWVKDTQLEFQYRQYIFVTITGEIDPSKNYRIVVAPGITAKNGSTNTSGSNLYFSFSDPGSGGEEPEDPGGQEDPPEEPAEEPAEETPKDKSKEKSKKKKKTENKKEKTQKKQTKQPATQPSVNQSGTGSSGRQSGTVRPQSGTNQARAAAPKTRPSLNQPARQKETPVQPDVVEEDGRKAYRLTANTAGRFSALLSPISQEEEMNTMAQDSAAYAEDRYVIFFSLLGCLGLILAGGASEVISFKRRLKRRS